MSIKEYYEINDQYGNRYDTDFQHIDVTFYREFSGIMDKQARFIEEKQLFNEDDWELFVHQFEIAADDVDDGWRGEYFGKMMRGACMTYQYTKNKKLYELLYKVAEKMLDAQDERGRFSTYSLSCEFNGWDMWCRKYVILGFLHFHEICDDGLFKEKIEAALIKHLDYIVEHIGSDKIDLSKTSTFWLGINSASILEPVIKMYNITGKEAYLSFAEYIIDFLTNSKANIIALALENKLMPYQYPVTKAYEMMSCFEGLLEYYRVTGEEKWKTAVINFADSVKKSDITVIGCAGCEHELFNHAVATQTDTDYMGIMQETCVTVTWMKLCNQLLLLTGDGKYADYIEQSFYNALYGAVNNNQNKTNGGFLFDSYSPLTLGKRGRMVGGYKNISSDKYYGCCAAIGAAGTALPLLTAITTTNDGIAINYYEQGNATVNGYNLAIETNYPAEETIKIKIIDACQDKGCIYLRIPEFSGKNTKIFINGQAHPMESLRESSYLSLCKEWKGGDTIEIIFDMNPRTIRPCGVVGKDETKDYFAVLYGPLVLARDAQITQVGNSVKFSDKLEIAPKDNGGFECVFRANVWLGNDEMDMIDYGSAGKTWDDISLTEAWIKCE